MVLFNWAIVQTYRAFSENGIIKDGHNEGESQIECHKCISKFVSHLKEAWTRKCRHAMASRHRRRQGWARTGNARRKIWTGNI